MTDDERKMVINLADTIEGEINRICVTDDKQEFVIMSEYACHNIFKLIRLINIIRFKMSFDDIVQNRFKKTAKTDKAIYCDTDSIKTTKTEDKNKCGV